MNLRAHGRTELGQPVVVWIDVDKLRAALFPEEKKALDRATEALEQIATYVPEKKPREFQFLVLKNIARRALRAMCAGCYGHEGDDVIEGCRWCLR